MSALTQENLIDLLDNQLEGDALNQVQEQLKNDAAAKSEFEALQFSVALVREAGLQQQVADIRRELQSGAVVKIMRPEQSGGVLHSMFGNAMRIAVMLMVVLGAAVVYQLVSTNGAAVVGDQFSSYELNTSRGTNADTDLETAYRNKDWGAVKTIFNSLSAKTAKSWLLAGMADMELKEYNAAITDFISLQEQNERGKQPLFQEEAEYYLALAYMGAGKSSKGVDILEKIRANKNHLFHAKANEISSLTLKTLEIKGDN